ncbi:hypothetical protein MKZ38_000429 [Zalerion maritima]|uniref:Uncharacterized protein n=1 Tax=Zalerion maritima TaxID=339359 RepID=A0AAD5WVQ3_9PEZI|nr:hypothetical protein MKZ38_000429 [Zalerion maritima]
MFFYQFFTVALATLGLAMADSTPTLGSEEATGTTTAPTVTTTSAAINFINTATVTCLHAVCMHGYSYCWYWPTMEVGIGSLGAEPSFTLAAFATCSDQGNKTSTPSTLDTVTVTTPASSGTETEEAFTTGGCEEESETASATDDCTDEED